MFPENGLRSLIDTVILFTEGALEDRRKLNCWMYMFLCSLCFCEKCINFLFSVGNIFGRKAFLLHPTILHPYAENFRICYICSDKAFSMLIINNLIWTNCTYSYCSCSFLMLFNFWFFTHIFL